jgi:heme-degrading monooxygenase HmoA
MIVVIFEVIPKEGHKEAYLEIAAELKSYLNEMDGFISVERFQSLTHPHKILSLSFWRDEEAVKQWRQLEPHREAQHAGRKVHFEDYRLRVASVSRDYGMFSRDEAPEDSRKIHDTTSSA